ncbi:family 78 glycoside hydrolase catalytic domain [Microbacterium sp. NPDC089189]|uniref:family 78 glycoside hydrolase catalytic domain n=1 Tax=Microbacterium sp. NPDC089189 TaxID=3154972 RepID=UPI003442AF83
MSEAAPRLSWKVSGPGAQTAYRLQALRDGVPLAEVQAESGRHLVVGWPWAPLSSGAQVRWRVSTRNADADWSRWSAWSDLECGLLDADWTADWISPVEEPGHTAGRRPAYVLEATFDPPAVPVARARLYATALGVYEAFVNDTRAGTAELSPGSTSYDKTLYAQASDVAASLRAGRNTLRIVLSDGWFRGQVGAHRMPAQWGPRTAARAELHLDLVDGTHQVVRTDARWTSRPSSIVSADLMEGERVDLTRAVPPAQPVEVGVVAAPPISWSPAPPVRVIEDRAVSSATRVADDTWVLDFGQNASGWVSLADLGPAGTRTSIDYGEHVDAAGDLSTSHLDSSRPGEPPTIFVQRDEVVSRGDGSSFEPRHTVHGFRYARIRRPDAVLDPATVRMRIVHTDLAPIAAFSCSDADLERLHAMAQWSFRGNAVDVPTDCPTRERLAWTGDYQVFTPTAARLYDVSGFTRKWLRSVRDDQLDDGRIANFSPDGRRIRQNLDDQFAMMTGSAGWGDAIVAVPWEMYRAYGDAEILAENWEAMRRWVEWALEAAASSRHHTRVARSAEPLAHERYLWDGTFHWGEWIEPQPLRADGTRADPVADDPMAWFMADNGEVGTAYLYRSTATVARIAALLGRPAEAERYAMLAERIRDAWQREFVSDDGRTAVDTQASYVRALAFDLLPSTLRGPAADRLVELIRRADTHLGTGFLSTGDLLPVLADAGYADVAYELLLQRTSPSWLAMLDRGATTVWEDWEGVDEHGEARESLNHYSKGAVVRFLHTHLVGLSQDEESAAWESFTVRPVTGGGLRWAQGRLDSPQGSIAVRWETDGSDIEITVDTPVGARGRVVFPDGTVREVTAGAFRERRAVIEHG